MKSEKFNIPPPYSMETHFETLCKEFGYPVINASFWDTTHAHFDSSGELQVEQLMRDIRVALVEF
jgi:hypothetical protein